MELQRIEIQEEEEISLKHSGYVKLTFAVIYSALKESINPKRALQQMKGGKKIKLKDIEIFLEKLKNWAVKDQIFIPAFSIFYKIDENYLREKIIKNCIETIRREKQKELSKILKELQETIANKVLILTREAIIIKAPAHFNKN